MKALKYTAVLLALAGAIYFYTETLTQSSPIPYLFLAQCVIVFGLLLTDECKKRKPKCIRSK